MAGVAGRSGRKPKPVARKVAAGNPGKRAINRDEPNFGAVLDVDPPADMDGLAREMWETLAPTLCSQGVLQVTDLPVLERYCLSYALYKKAEQHIATHGLTVPGAQGGMVKNPACTIRNEADRQLTTAGALLGLDPSSRQRLLGPKKRDSGAELAAILGM